MRPETKGAALCAFVATLGVTYLFAHNPPQGSGGGGGADPHFTGDDLTVDEVVLDVANQDTFINRQGAGHVGIGTATGQADGQATLATLNFSAGSITHDGSNLVVTPSTGALSSPGAGAGSEVFGAGASSPGSQGVALGPGCVVNGSNGIAIGANSTSGTVAGSDGHIIIGVSSTSVAGSGNDEGVAIGTLISVHGDAVAIGYNADTGGFGAVNVGHGSGAGTTGLALGISAESTAGADGIALGAYATTTKANQLVSGSTTAAISEMVIGEGVSDATPITETLWTTTNGSGTDIAATDLILSPGLGTGAGAPGQLIFKTGTTLGTGTTLQTATTRLLISEDGVSAPGGGTSSEAFGSGASAAGNLSTTLGSSASSGGANNVVIGESAANTGGNSVVVGRNAQGGSSAGCVLIGNGTASNNAVNLVAIGYGLSGTNSAVMVGHSVTAAGTGATCVGTSADDTAAGGYGTAIGYDASTDGGVAVGAQSVSSGNNQVAVGRSASATGTYSTALGRNASDGGFADCVVINGTATKANQMVVGANATEITEMVIGEGVTNAAPVAQTLWTTTNGVGTDIHATDLVLQSGLSTGAGAVTSMIFKTPDVGTTGTTTQTATTRLTLTEGSATFTAPVLMPRKLEDVTADNTLTDAETHKVLTNLGDAGLQTQTLPATPTEGTTFTFFVGVAQEMRIDPNTNEKIVDASMTGLADAEYITSSTLGSSITLVAMSDGDWAVIQKSGTWAEETP